MAGDEQTEVSTKDKNEILDENKSYMGIPKAQFVVR